MPDFSRRSDEQERIDDPALPDATFSAALDDLAKVNRLLRAHAPTLSFLERHAAGLKRFSLLDVGAGQGDLLRNIAAWATARGIEARLAGIDMAAGGAIASGRADTDAEWIVGDVFRYEPAAPFDFIVSLQFAHHLPDAQIVRFLRWMERHAVRAWHVSDLQRHRLAWYGFRALAAVNRWHPVVRHDGAVSVQRAFQRRDWAHLLRAGGIDDAEIRWHVPFRWGLSRVLP